VSSDRRPDLTFDVDLTNPGQFLACCGLLELASRISPGATGWFDSARFLLADCAADLIRQLTDVLIRPDHQATPSDKGEDGDSGKSPAVQFDAPFNLRLDWWLDPSAIRGGLKTWAGGQTVIGFIQGMRQRLAVQAEIGSGILRETEPLKKPKPFYFDARLARLTAIDAGFSAEQFTTAFSPASELLALVGLQRFRPIPVEARERYAYETWAVALPVSVAAAVAHGLVPCLSSNRFEFPLVVRTGGKYKAFGPAISLRRNHV
jgi:hypothetical protein